MKHVPRLASPVGFLLAALFFLLPFVAVSCEAPGIGSASASYTGLDLVTNGEPSVETTGAFNELKDADPNNATKVDVPQQADAAGPGTQTLAIITLALLVIGIGVSLAPVLRVRTFGVLGAAAAGGALLIATELVAQSNLESALRDSAKEATSSPADGLPNISGFLFDDLVHSRFGFWLALVAVLLVLVYNAGLLLWPRIRAASMPAAAPLPPPPPAPVEPEGEPPPPQ